MLHRPDILPNHLCQAGASPPLPPAAMQVFQLHGYAGTILVALADRIVDNQGSQADGGRREGPVGIAVLGDLLTLCAAALYAVYTVLIKMMMPEDSESDMMAFFGYMGLINALIFAPVVLIMQLAGTVDLWSIPLATLTLVFIKGLFLPGTALCSHTVGRLPCMSCSLVHCCILHCSGSSSNAITTAAAPSTSCMKGCMHSLPFPAA